MISNWIFTYSLISNVTVLLTFGLIFVLKKTKADDTKPNSNPPTPKKKALLKADME